MLFQSFEFLLLMVILLALLATVAGRKRWQWLLLIASYIFYGWANPWYLGLIGGSTLVDYVAGKNIARSAQRGTRRKWLLLSLATNLGLLGFFKYHAFFAQSLNSILQSDAIPFVEVLLPVGISFYTFQTMAYTVDVYRGNGVPAKSLREFALFVSFFPQLVAGPILRPSDFLPQLTKPLEFLKERTFSGFHLVLIGLAKKVLIADSIAPLVEVLLDQPGTINTTMAWMGALLFGAQIYADFSAYSDMARGLSRIFGFELPVNFNYPYLATSFSGFWRRWHISLSTWLRDYLYIPLGGNRKCPCRTYFNLSLTMLLGGLWHGAAWNFVIWGAYQGVLLIAERVVGFPGEKVDVARSARLSRLPIICGWLITQYFVFLGWLIFRVSDTSHMWACVKAYVVPDFTTGLRGIGILPAQPVTAIMAFLILAIAHFYHGRRGGLPDRMDRWSARKRYATYFVVFLLFFFFWPNEETAFIYFQF